MMSSRERKTIINKIRLLAKITIENGATENETVVARDKIEVLRNKLKTGPYEYDEIPEPKIVDIEKAKKEHEAIMNAFNKFAEKNMKDYKMDQHIAQTESWDDVDF